MAHILLLSQDPAIRGGAATAARIASALVHDLGHDVTEAYVANLSRPRISRHPAGPLRWYLETPDGFALMAVLPELQVPPLWSGRHALRRLSRTQSWDRVLVVGATVHHGVVADGLGLPVSVWGATTMRDERRAQWAAYDPVRGALHRAALPLIDRAERRVLTAAQHVAGMSPYASSVLGELAARPVAVLYPPVEVPVSVDAQCRADRLRNGTLSCIFVGRVADPRKRFDRVMALAGDLAASGRYLRVELSVTATDDELRATRTPAGVHLVSLGHPSTDELRSSMANAHWLLLASEQEGFGFVVAEAFACGTPVASTASGGPETMIAASAGGVVDDASALATRVCAVDPDAWCAMSGAARSFAERTFSRDAALPGFARLLGAA